VLESYLPSERGSVPRTRAISGTRAILSDVTYKPRYERYLNKIALILRHCAMNLCANRNPF
jgi:hypothetical protein